MDVARFGAFATPRYTKAKVIENYRRRFRLAFPNEELPAARPLRRTPIYDRLKNAGAVFGANFGLEHALVVRPPRASSPWRSRPIAAPTPSRMCKAECHAVRTAVGIYETSNYGKYEVTGRGARGFLDRLLACKRAEARPHGDRADAVRARPHRRRPLRRLPRRGPLSCWSARALPRRSTCAGSRRRSRRPTSICARPPRR